MSEYPLEPLGNICEINPDTLTEASDPTRRYRYIDLSSIKEQKTDLRITPLPFAVLPSRARRRVAFNDVLLGTVRPNLKNFAIIESEDNDLLCSTGFAVLRSKKNISDPRFIFHVINSEIATRQLNALVTGSNYPAVNVTQVADLLIPIPPLPEQKKIAEILSGIDSTMGNLKSYLAKQEILKKSVVSKLIFNKDNDCRRIGETDRNYCLADVSTRITDGTHQAVKTSKNGTIPFLYISCIKDGIIDWSKSAFISAEQYAIATQGRQPSSGDILYTVVGSYGNAVMVSTSKQFCFQRHIALIQLDQKQVEPKFIEIALCSEEVKKSVDKVVAGNAQPTLTLGELRKLQIPLPSLNMQRRICQIISPLELKISALEKKIEAMKSLKTAMSADLLSGRKRVSI